MESCLKVELVCKYGDFGTIQQTICFNVFSLDYTRVAFLSWWIYWTNYILNRRTNIKYSRLPNFVDKVNLNCIALDLSVSIEPIHFSVRSMDVCFGTFSWNAFRIECKTMFFAKLAFSKWNICSMWSRDKFWIHSLKNLMNKSIIYST